MYIPETILVLILCALIFYSYIKNEKHKEELNQKEKSLKEKAYLERQEQKEKEENSKKIYAIELLKKLYKCNDIEANSMFNVLKETSLIECFLEATSTDKEKRNTFEYAKQKLKEKEDLRNYFNTNLLPIIKNNSYNITFEEFEWHKEIFYKRPEISIETKLLQLNYDQCMNISILHEALRMFYSSPENIFYDEQREQISFEHLINIVKCYNSFFNMGLDESTIISLRYKYDLFHIGEKHLNCDFLENVFVSCVYSMKLIPKSIYNDKRLTSNENNYAFEGFIKNLFFFRPYFNIKDYKKIILSHLEELKEYQDRWAS